MRDCLIDNLSIDIGDLLQMQACVLNPKRKNRQRNVKAKANSTVVDIRISTWCGPCSVVCGPSYDLFL